MNRREFLKSAALAGAAGSSLDLHAAEPSDGAPSGLGVQRTWRGDGRKAADESVATPENF